MACVFFCLESPASHPNRRTAIREPRTYCHSLDSFSFPLLVFLLDYRDLMRIYRRTTAKHRASSRPTETAGGKAEASRNCGTQIVKLIMPSVHGFFIDVDFLRNDTKRLLSEVFSPTVQQFSRRIRQVNRTYRL